LLNDDAVTLVAAGNSRGWIAGGNWKRAQAQTGCPGIAASSTTCSSERVGPLATARLQGCGSQNRAVAPAAGKSGTPQECCRTSKIVPLPLAAGRQQKSSTKRCGAGGWPAPHLFLQKGLAAELRGSAL